MQESRPLVPSHRRPHGVDPLARQQLVTLTDVHVRRGEAVCVPGGEPYVVDGDATLYKATVPNG